MISPAKAKELERSFEDTVKYSTREIDRQLAQGHRIFYLNDMPIRDMNVVWEWIKLYEEAGWTITNYDYKEYFFTEKGA